VAFSPDGKQLVSASKDRNVQILDVGTGKSIFTLGGGEQDVMAVAFTGDGKAVLSSGFEPGIVWWNAQTGEKIKTQAGHGIAVHELAVSKDGKRIVSAGADRTVRIWDGTAGTAVKVLSVGSVAYSVAISPSGKLVAAGSFDGLVRIWDEATGRHLVSLLGLAGEGDRAEWLAITPEGFATGSDRLVEAGRWRINGQEVPGAAVWTSLRQPQVVAGACRGEPIPAVKFTKQ
jgi:WD40 repeat protein